MELMRKEKYPVVDKFLSWGWVQNKEWVFWLGIALLLGLLLQVCNILISPEYDESGYLYYAQEILRGKTLYRDVYSFNKPPGVPYLYAGVFFIAGESHTAVRIFGTLYILLTVVAVFYLAKLLYGEKCAVVTAFAFVFLNNRPFLQKGATQPETFMVLPLIVGVYSCWRAEKTAKNSLIFLGGMLFSIAFIFKPVVATNLLGVLVFYCCQYFLESQKPQLLIKKSLLLLAGFCLPILLLCVYLISQNAFWPMLEDIYTINREFVLRRGWSSPLDEFLYTAWRIFIEGFVVYFFFLYGLFAILKERGSRHIFLLMQLLFSCIGICLTMRFPTNYYIQWAPFIAILAGFGILLLKEKYDSLHFSKRLAVVATLFLFCSLSLAADIIAVVYKGYSHCIYDEVVSYVKENTKPEDSIYIPGSPVYLYFLTGRQSGVHAANSLDQMEKEALELLNVNLPKLVIMWSPDSKNPGIGSESLERFGEVFLKPKGYTLKKVIPFKARWRKWWFIPFIKGGWREEYFYIYGPPSKAKG